MNVTQRLKQEIIEVAKELLEKGLVVGTGGNLSICLREEGLILITPSGIDYNQMVLEDIVILDLQGNIVEGTRRPSVEKNMHLELYNAREDICAVIHTHSLYASAVAVTREDLPVVLSEMAVVFGGAVRTARYAKIGTKELAENVLEVLGDSCAALLSNHGAVGVGKNLQDVLKICELLEISAKVYILSKVAGSPVILSDEAIMQEKKHIQAIYGQFIE